MLDTEYFELLFMAAFARPREEQVAIAEAFRDSPDRKFWVALLNEEPVGGCAVIESDADTAQIRYIAIKQVFRGQGIGRLLIDATINNTQKKFVEAETGDNAKDFYRTCGFAIHSLGEKYPGTIRYLCRYTKRGTPRPPTT